MNDPVNPLGPPGYSDKCRACKSAHRPGIDERLLKGEAARAVAAWLLDTHGERIPFQALLNHKAAHLGARSAAAAIAESAEPVFQAAVARIVADAGVLDEVASIGLRVARALEPVVCDPKVKLSQPVATVFAAALANARAAVTDRHEMLHGKKLEVTGVGPSQNDDVEDLHRRTAAALAAATGGADPGAVEEPPASPTG